jgi:hypothetical protein
MQNHLGMLDVPLLTHTRTTTAPRLYFLTCQEQRAVEAEIKRLELEREAAELKQMRGNERSQRKIEATVKKNERERESQELELMVGVEDGQAKVEDEKRELRHKRSRLGHKIVQSVLCTTCAESEMLAYLQEYCEVHEKKVLALLGKKSKSDVSIDAGEAMIKRKREKKQFDELHVHCRLRKELGSHIRCGKIEASDMFHVVVDEFETGLKMKVGVTKVTTKESNAIEDPEWLTQTEPSPEKIDPATGHPIKPAGEGNGEDETGEVSMFKKPKKTTKGLWKRGMKKTNKELYSAILQDDPKNCVVSGRLALLLMENGEEGFLPLLKQAVVDEVKRVKEEEERLKREDQHMQQLEKLKKKFKAKGGGGGAAGVLAAKAKLKGKVKEKEGKREKSKKGQKRLRQAAAKKGKVLKGAAALKDKGPKEDDPDMAKDDEKPDDPAAKDVGSNDKDKADVDAAADKKADGEKVSGDGEDSKTDGDAKAGVSVSGENGGQEEKPKAVSKGLSAFGGGGGGASKLGAFGVSKSGDGGADQSSKPAGEVDPESKARLAAEEAAKDPVVPAQVWRHLGRQLWRLYRDTGRLDILRESYQAYSMALKKVGNCTHMSY